MKCVGQREAQYLIALNNELMSMERNKILELAKNSLIREKIKIIELKKNFDLYCKRKKNDTSYNLFQIINIGYWYKNI